jgi:hypothetical protein
VNLTLRVLFRPDESKLGQIFRNLGLDYDERVLPSLGNEVLKSVVVSGQMQRGERKVGKWVNSARDQRRKKRRREEKKRMRGNERREEERGNELLMESRRLSTMLENLLHKENMLVFF